MMSMYTPDRLVATVAALVALAGVVVGVLAVFRPAPRRPVLALVAGLFALVVGTFVVVTADGGPGTGNGIVGGWAALALGLVAIALGGLTTARRRRVGGGRA